MASLKEVAKKAGVSPSTVSRVVNNLDLVPPKTKKKVQRAIKALNYKPNKIAQRLRSKVSKRNLVGLLIPDIQNPFYVDVVRGVEDYFFAEGYAVLIGNFMQDEKKAKLYLDIMNDEEIDGLIVAPTRKYEDEIIQFIEKKTPVVCVDRGFNNLDVDIVLVDNEDGSFKAIEHLIKLGHKRIAYIGGLLSIPTTIERRNGYLKALRQYGIPIDEQLIKFGDSKQSSGKRLTSELLSLKKKPTALFTGNNLITLGALETIYSRGLKIPTDVAIIGFDDMPWSISLNPPLTAVSQPGYQIGRQAAKLLFEKILEPEKEYIKLILKTKLILRNSC